MPYKNKEDRRKYAADYVKIWRSNPENKKKQDERRKELRDNDMYGYRDKWNKYYAENKERIISKTVEYQTLKPEVKKKSFNKAKLLGKGIEKGIKERRELYNGYVYSLLRKELKVDNNFLDNNPLIVEAKKIYIKIKRKTWKRKSKRLQT
jgi:hypothetical protein